MPTPLANALRKARADARLTQAQTAGLVGVHLNAVTRWESGRSRPTKKTRARVLDAFAKVNPAGAPALRQAFAEAFPRRLRNGAAAPPPAPPPPAAPVFPKRVWVEQAVFRLADQLDVSPRRARGAARRMMKLLTEGKISTDEALAELSKPEADDAHT